MDLKTEHSTPEVGLENEVRDLVDNVENLSEVLSNLTAAKTMRVKGPETFKKGYTNKI